MTMEKFRMNKLSLQIANLKPFLPCKVTFNKSQKLLSNCGVINAINYDD